jgi:hypothetical protein
MKFKSLRGLVFFLILLTLFSSVSAQQTFVEAAIGQAQSRFSGIGYSWSLGAHCSTFVSAYLEDLGFRVEPNNDALASYTPQYGSALPQSNTLKQVKWMLMHNDELGGGYAYQFTAGEAMSASFWTTHTIPVGSVIYLTKELTDNGIDAPAHTIIYRGNIGEAGAPVFADFALGMKNGPMLNRSLKQIGDGLYFDENINAWDMKETLPVYLFDVVGMMGQSPKGYADFPSPTEFVSGDVMNRTAAFSDIDAPWATGGAVPPNTSQVTNYDVFLTVNLFDGTAALYEKQNGGVVQVPFEGDRMELYTILGRGLKVNKSLTDLYAASDWAKDGSHYDGKNGIYYYANGIPRTTYTPPFMAEYQGTMVVVNFGLIGGKTSIALLLALIRQDDGTICLDTRHSHYTVHAVPQDTPEQDVLLREPDLEAANSLGGPFFGALKFPTLNRSSGCVNFDRPSWYNILTPRMNAYQQQGKKVLVIFTYPSIDQDQTIRPSHYMMDDPLSNLSVKNTWEYDIIRDARTFAPGTGA